jgi:hypothetical protein
MPWSIGIISACGAMGREIKSRWVIGTLFVVKNYIAQKHFF